MHDSGPCVDRRAAGFMDGRAARGTSADWLTRESSDDAAGEDVTEILVVGGGIVGLSTAYWLAKAGHGVTVVERGAIPNPEAASADHHRLIRFSYGDRLGYAARMGEAFAAWRTMWSDLGQPEARYYVPTGVLSLSVEQGDRGDRSLGTLEALGLAHERLEGAEISRRLPFLEPDGVRFALLAEGGALMANRILVDLADWLRRDGVAVLEQSPVTAIDPVAGQVTLADGRTLGAETVVVSAGIFTSDLLPLVRARPRRAAHRHRLCRSAGRAGRPLRGRALLELSRRRPGSLGPRRRRGAADEARLRHAAPVRHWRHGSAHDGERGQGGSRRLSRPVPRRGALPGALAPGEPFHHGAGGAFRAAAAGSRARRLGLLGAWLQVRRAVRKGRGRGRHRGRARGGRRRANGRPASRG